MQCFGLLKTAGVIGMPDLTSVQFAGSPKSFQFVEAGDCSAHSCIYSVQFAKADLTSVNSRIVLLGFAEDALPSTYSLNMIISVCRRHCLFSTLQPAAHPGLLNLQGPGVSDCFAAEFSGQTKAPQTVDLS